MCPILFRILSEYEDEYEDEYEEHVIFSSQNKGGYRLELIAQLSGPNITNVRYSVRAFNPHTGDSIDYDPSLGDLEEFGALLIALSDFAKLTIYADSRKRKKWLRKILNPEKIHRLAPAFGNAGDKGIILKGDTRA